MTARYPLVLNGTTIEELQSADTLAGVDAFASGTTMLFLQAAAPSGWTKSTANNDKALRIVSGSGGGTGGSVAFSSAFASGNTGATTLSTSQIPSHNHLGSPTLAYYTSGASSAANNIFQLDYNRDAGYTTRTMYTYASSYFAVASNGSGGSHTHSLSLAVQYVDAIICVKD